MSDKQVKLIRGQLRQLIKEMLPELLSEELKSAMHQKLAVEVQKQLDNLKENMKNTLNTIDERSKDIQGYLVRQTSTVQGVTPAPSETLKVE